MEIGIDSFAAILPEPRDLESRSFLTIARDFNQLSKTFCHLKEQPRECL